MLVVRTHRDDTLSVDREVINRRLMSERKKAHRQVKGAYIAWPPTFVGCQEHPQSVWISALQTRLRWTRARNDIWFALSLFDFI